MKLDGSSLKPLECDPAGRLAAEVVRTTVDPFLGRVCLVRVFSGTLREDSSIHIGGRGLADRGHEDHDADERVTHLYSPVGSSLKAVPTVHCRRYLRHQQAGQRGNRATLSRSARPRC